MRLKGATVRFAQRDAQLWLGHASSRAARAAAVLGLVGCVGLAAYEGQHWQQRHAAQVAKLEALQARLARAARERPAPPPRFALSAQQVARHNAAVAQLNTPWSDVLDALERNADAQVGLTQLEPDAKRQTLRIQAEAKHVGTLIRYAERLASDAAFGRLELLQHETNEQDPNRPSRLSFELSLAAIGPGGHR